MSKHAAPSKLTVPPPGVHPLARFIFAEMKRLRCTYDEMEARSGVLRSTVKIWRRPTTLPHIPTLEAALGVLGWRLEALPSADTLPLGLRRDLERLAERHAEKLPALNHLPEIPVSAVN